METIIALVISIIGAVFLNVDFNSTFTLLNIAIMLYKEWISNSNDKTTTR